MDQPAVNGAAGAGTGRGGTVVEAVALTKTYRRGPERVRALRGMDIRIEAGEVVALVGPSGSGKTTLLNIICGWEEPDGGRVEWHGPHPERPQRDRRWAELAVVPQDLGLVAEVTVAENVLLPLWLADRFGDDDSERAMGYLDRFNLAHYRERAPAELSLGEQQRLAVARAMVVRPRLLLADEPTGHQDAGSAELLFGAFRTLAADGGACLVATHSEEFLEHADRIVAMRDGRIAAAADQTT
jgi:ABC-type lipoprotein export system ATPase subunit